MPKVEHKPIVKPVIIEPKPQPKVEIAPPQYVDDSEPSFLEKYRNTLIFMGVCVLGFLMWLAVKPKADVVIPNPNPNPPSISSDETAFLQAKNTATIPAFEQFLKNYPNSPKRSDADQILRKMKNDFNIAIKNAEAYKGEDTEKFKAELQKARRLNPDGEEIFNLLK